MFLTMFRMNDRGEGQGHELVNTDHIVSVAVRETESHGLILKVEISGCPEPRFYGAVDKPVSKEGEESKETSELVLYRFREAVLDNSDPDGLDTKGARLLC